MEETIYLTKASLPGYDEYVEEIKTIWDNNWITTFGPKHSCLESTLMKFLQCEKTMLFANGHCALEMTIQAMGLSGEVITTPYTFASTTNMLYSRDLSKKIWSAQMARARKGEYLGGFARYGYEKSPEDKHRLVVDPEAAEVVRKIFTMAAEGVTISGIVWYLNDNGVPACVEYKQRKNSRYQHPGEGVKKLWGTQSVRSMLLDELFALANERARPK